MSVYVYVFDVNGPLVARSLRGKPTEPGMTVTTTIVEDIEEMLPAVDPECAAVPYIVYRFPLSHSIACIGGRAGAPPGITEVAMSMTGLTAEFHAGSLPYEKRFQTWTV